MAMATLPYIHEVYQSSMVIQSSGSVPIQCPVQDQQVQKLSDDKIKELADIGKRVQQHYLFPQDMEWAFAGGELYLTQARPITTLGDESTPKPTDTSNLTSGLTQILKGAPASPGLVSGPVRIVENVKS
jgi:pyruvate,water dikinase